MSAIAPRGRSGDAEIQRLRTLYQLVSALSRATTLDEIYEAAITSLLSATEADRASILMFDEDGVMRFKAWRGLSDGYRAAVTGHTPWTRGALDAQPLMIHDVLADPSLADYEGTFAAEGIRALAFIPLALDAGVFGKFMLYYAQPHEFGQDEMDVAEAIATHVAMATQRKRSELARVQSEARLQAILDNSATIVFLKDLDGRYVLVNRQYKELFDIAGTGITGRTDFEIFPPEVAERFIENDGTVMAAGASLALEESVPQPDGIHDYISVKFPIREPDGAISGIGGISTDITERKKTEAALRNLAAIVENSYEAIIGTDATGTIISWNPSAERIFGYSASDAVGHSLVDLAGADESQEVQRIVEEVLNGRNVRDRDMRRRQKDGRIVDVLVTASPVRNTKGRIVGISAIIRDVTEQRLAEDNLRRSNEALRESEDHYRHTVELNSQVPWTAGVDGKLEDFSPQWLRLTGLTREQALATGWVDVPHPDDLAAMTQAWEHSMRTAEMFDLEHRIRVADGSYRWMRTRARPRRDAEGRIVRWYGNTEDIDDRKRAEIELRRAKRQVDNILGSIRESFIALDREWRFTYVNERVVARTKATREGLIGKNIWEEFPESKAPFGEGYRRCMEERVPVHFEAAFPPWRNDGSPRYYEVHAYPTDEGICAYVQDITDRKRAEEALAESERRFRAFVTTSSDVIYCMNPDGRDMRPLRGTDSVSGILTIHPDERERVEAARAAAVRHKSPFESEHRVIREDGTVAWVATSAVPLLDSTGAIVEWFGAARDVTSRKRAEAAMAELTARSEQQRRLYDTILSNTPDLVYVFDLHHRFTYANHALLTMWGKTWDEAIGRNCLELGYEPWHAAMHDREIEQVVATREPIRGQVPFTGTHGRRIYDYIFVPVIGANGEVEAIAGTTRDVTDQKQAEDELRRANRDLEQFAYSASHDLQEPLRSVKIYSELLATRCREKLNGEELKYCDFLRTGATRMETLVRDLLAYTQASVMERPTEKVDAARCLRLALDNLSSTIAESGATVVYRDLPSVPVLAAHLQQLFQNLIGNAIKYRRPEVAPEVAIAAQRRDEAWLFSVKDNGIGIEREYQERVFGLFKRLHTSAEYSGTGIGLALCVRILEHYHGRIWVESEPGAGSTFYFTVPA
ncbi:MAG TPA: PAS domain S-box protein [Bryobacteraceae bacterium]|nr:PAS domain S-box protein [Bryobacteraceae bacterium]